MPHTAPVSTPSEVQEPRYEAVWAAQAPDYDQRAQRQNRQPEAYQSSGAARGTHERPISAEAIQALNNAGVRMGDTARVQQIMVLFTDGRFEAFTPADQ